MRRWLLLLWLLLLLEAFFLAPPELPSTPGMIWRIMTFDWVGISPTLIGLFYAVGALCCLHASFLLTAVRQTKPHPLPMVMASFVLGSFVLLPYLALRRHGPEHEPRKSWLSSPVVRVALMAALISYVLFGLLAGDLDMFWYELATRKFSHVMMVDFAVLAVLLPFVAAERL